MVIHREDNQHGMPALTVSPIGRHITCNECRLWGELAEDVITALQVAPVQGPAGAPFRPGDRFRMVSGDGRVVRTGTIVQWDVPYHNSRPGHWYVEVDPLPRPSGARVRKHNPWDGFRSWFDADQLERLP